MALATGDLATAWSSGPTPVTAIGTDFVDRFAGSLKTVAVELFGSNDKRALLIGIVVIAIAIGALLGVVTGARPRRLAVGFGAFGLLGAVAMGTHPLSTGWGVAIAVNALAVAAGVSTFVVLTRLLPHDAEQRELSGERAVAARSPDSSREHPTTIDRRRFTVAIGGTVAVVAGVAQLGRNARVLDVAAQPTLPSLPSLPTPTTTSVAAPPATAGAAGAATFDIPGLSSFITPNSEFFRIDTALQVPRLDTASWTLTIDGMVDTPVTLTFDELLTLPSVEHTVTLQCVSNEVNGNLVGNAVWQGVPLGELLDRAGVDPAVATQVVGHSVDRFTAGFPTAAVYDGRTALVAYAMNGAPLPFEHGFPARLVVAGLYGYVSATKWLERIELTTWEAFDGYWVPRGWSKEGPVKTMARIDVPTRDADLRAGPTAIAGVAWAPNVGIGRVEVQVDGGDWVDCELNRIDSDETWVQWMTPWEASPGEHAIRARATDRAGTTQTEQVAPVAPSGATGYPTRHVVVR